MCIRDRFRSYSPRFGVGSHIVVVSRSGYKRSAFHRLFDHVAHAEEADADVYKRQGKAFSATGIQNEQQLIADVTMSVISQFTNPTMTVEEIQDLVEKALMKVRPEVATKYIICLLYTSRCV